MHANKVMLIAVVMSIAVALSAGAEWYTDLAEDCEYPFAQSTVLFGFCPPAVWSYGAFLSAFAFDDATLVKVVELTSGTIVAEKTLSRWEVLDVEAERGRAYKIVADRPVACLFGTVGCDSCPGMSFVPSRMNEGKEFFFYFPGTSPGWGQPYQRCVNVFAWEEADVTVRNVLDGTVYWEGHIDAGHYSRLTPPRSRYVVSSTGVLTVQLLALCDASSFVLDRSQTGCGKEFMFHVLSPGIEHGRHSFYEVHAFEDAEVTVYDINDPSNPVLFDEFHMSEGGHTVEVFDYYNDVFLVRSTGRVSVLAGSFQTCVGGVHGPQSIGDMYTSVPSFDGNGMRFLLGLHCANFGYAGSGFILFATEDDTKVHVGQNTFDLDQDQWVWITQPDIGVFFYDICSNRPIHVQTGSIGGDNDFDNIMTFLGGFGKPGDVCQPVEPWVPRTQGYWRRQCKDKPHEDICAHVDSVHALADLFDAFDCDSVCCLMNVDQPENDMCRKARRQFMALLLNVASGKLAVCNCLENGREVGDVAGEIDSLLSNDPDFHVCEYAKTLADDLNNGIGIVSCDHFRAQTPSKAVQPLPVSVTPNPFARSTVIDYEVGFPGRVRLEVYDKAGMLVRALVDAEQPFGPHHVEWDGSDSSGRQVSSGIYFSRLELGNSVSSNKLVLLR